MRRILLAALLSLASIGGCSYLVDTDKITPVIDPDAGAVDAAGLADVGEPDASQCEGHSCEELLCSDCGSKCQGSATGDCRTSFGLVCSLPAPGLGECCLLGGAACDNTQGRSCCPPATCIASACSHPDAGLPDAD